MVMRCVIIAVVTSGILLFLGLSSSLSSDTAVAVLGKIMLTLLLATAVIGVVRMSAVSSEVAERDQDWKGDSFGKGKAASTPVKQSWENSSDEAPQDEDNDMSWGNSEAEPSANSWGNSEESGKAFGKGGKLASPNKGGKPVQPVGQPGKGNGFEAAVQQAKLAEAKARAEAQLGKGKTVSPPGKGMVSPSGKGDAKTQSPMDLAVGKSPPGKGDAKGDAKTKSPMELAVGKAPPGKGDAKGDAKTKSPMELAVGKAPPGKGNAKGDTKTKSPMELAVGKAPPGKGDAKTKSPMELAVMEQACGKGKSVSPPGKGGCKGSKGGAGSQMHSPPFAEEQDMGSGSWGDGGATSWGTEDDGWHDGGDDGWYDGGSRAADGPVPPPGPPPRKQSALMPPPSPMGGAGGAAQRAAVSKMPPPLPGPPHGGGGPFTEQTESGTLTLKFPAAAAGRLIGKGGETIKQVRQATGADVKMEKDEANDVCAVLISGLQDQVHKARTFMVATGLKAGFNAEVKGWVPNTAKPSPPSGPPPSVPIYPTLGAEQSGTLTLVCASDAAGRLIGKGGEHIKLVRQNTGADIQVTKDEAAGTCDVAITGSGDSVNKARAEMVKLAVKIGQNPQVKGWEEGGVHNGGRGQKRDRDEGGTQFDRELAGQILGLGNQKLEEIKAESGAQIVVNKLGHIFELCITGNPDAVQHAKELLNQAAEAGKERGWGTPGWVRDGQAGRDEDAFVFKLKREDAMKCIGKAGCVSKRIRAESGVHLNADLPDEGDNCTVRVSGTLEAVDKARSMIVDVLRNEDDPAYTSFQDECYMKIAHHESKRIIGKAGAMIKLIRDKTGAKVHVDQDSGELTLVRITGSPMAVENARELIIEVLKGTRFEEIQDIEVEQERHDDGWEDRRGKDRGKGKDREDKGRRKGGGKIGRFGRSSRGKGNKR